MEIENVQERAVFRFYLHMQTTAPLSSDDGNVVIARTADRMTREQHIAVGAATVAPVFAEFAGETEPVCEIAGLLMVRLLPFPADDFLKGDDVGIDFLQYPEDSIGHNATVEPATLVDVVSDHTEPV